MLSDYGMVIIGAGETGARAAVELRSRGWTGPVSLVGEEAYLPYERPPLSKMALLADEEPAPVVISGTGALADHDIQFIGSARAVRIDRERHAVELADGSQLPYERLLIAAGARPRKLALGNAGSEVPGILYLRTFADALALRKRLRPGQRIAVIGGGFIGLEVAASARQRGCSVTVVEAGPRILMRGVPASIAAIVDARHRSAGVSFALGVGIRSIHSSGNETVITLLDGNELACDAVIAGIGAIPETALAADCGLPVDNGIRVDGKLATTDPDIFAAGDCCSFPHPLYGGARIRLEAWRNAQDQAMHAAGNMLGAGEIYETVPWFWSDQYDLTLQVAGLCDSGALTVHRSLGDMGDLYFHLAGDNRIVAASGIGQPGIAREIRLAEMLIGRRSIVDPAALVQPEIKLKSLLKV